MTATDAAKTNRKGKLTAEQINHAVADWLRQHAVADPLAVKVRHIAVAIGVSVGSVAQSSAWRVFQEERQKHYSKIGREVPLTDDMLARLPAPDRNAQLEELIREQETDWRRDHRRRPPRSCS